MVSIGPIYAYFDMDERTFLQCRRHLRDKIKEKQPLFLGLASGPGLPHRGVVDFMDNSVDPKTGTIRFRGVFPNGEKLLMPGMFARVRLPLGEPHKALLVDESAVLSEVGKSYVLVVGDKNVARRREVKLVPTSMAYEKSWRE